jgi:hypothetical protein
MVGLESRLYASMAAGHCLISSAVPNLTLPVVAAPCPTRSRQVVSTTSRWNSTCRATAALEQLAVRLATRTHEC